MNGKRVLIIGGAGYIGTALTEELLERGYHVINFDCLLYGEKPIQDFLKYPQYRFVKGDMRHIEEVTTLLSEKPYGIVLLGGIVGNACDVDEKLTLDVNVFATSAIVRATKRYKIERLIFASTDSVYGVQKGIMYENSPTNPISLYAETKQEIEKEILKHIDGDFHPTILRMATVYGLSKRMRFDLVVNTLIMNATTKGKIILYSGEQWRPLVHVQDAARAFIDCLNAPLEKVGGQIFNVGSNKQNYQLKDLGKIVRQVFPTVKTEVIEETPDLRDYYVNFDKIKETIEYHVKYQVIDGMKEIADAIVSGELKDCDDRRYYNAKILQ